MTKKPTNIDEPCLKKFKMGRKIFRFGLLFFIALLVFIGFWWQWATSSIRHFDQSEQIFIVPQGQTAKLIGYRLLEANLIKSQLAFELLVDRKNFAHQLQAGDFKLSPSMDLNTILETLVHGSLDYWITFPEGWRVEEYADRLTTKSDIDTRPSSLRH